MQIPTMELASYRDSYDAAQSAGRDVLTQFEATRKRADAISARTTSRAPKPSEAFRRNYAAKSAESEGGNVDLAARYRAFETIARYNDTLLAIAEGKNANEIKGKVEGFTGSLETLIGSLGSAVPGLSLATPIIATVFEQAQKAQDAETFRTLVKAGEPVIEAIVNDVLLPDIAAYYKLRQRVDQREIYTPAKVEAAANAIAIHRLVANRYAPTGDLVKQRDAAFERLSEALTILEIGGLKKRIEQGAQMTEVALAGPFLSLPGPTQPASVDSTLEYTVVVQNQVAIRVENAEEAAQSAIAAIDDLNAYEGLLQNYELLLGAMLRSLKTLRANLDTPRKASAVFQEVLPIALSIKGDLRALRTP